MGFALSQLKAGTLSQPKGADNLLGRDSALRCLDAAARRPYHELEGRLSARSNPRVLSFVIPSKAKSRNLLIDLHFAQRSARDETSIAVHNRRARQNMFPKIRATAAP